MAEKLQSKTTHPQVQFSHLSWKVIFMNKGTILVIEDDKAIQNLIATTLEINNYNYQTASNATEGILKFTSYNPDVLILDLGLPDSDGIHVIKKIRDRKSTRLNSSH